MKCKTKNICTFMYKKNRATADLKGAIYNNERRKDFSECAKF